ncbi:MAG: hypothetical protein ACE5K4_06305 [Candidatus Hydrothermarchaeota archaeon]
MDIQELYNLLQGLPGKLILAGVLINLAGQYFKKGIIEGIGGLIVLVPISYIFYLYVISVKKITMWVMVLFPLGTLLICIIGYFSLRRLLFP